MKGLLVRVWLVHTHVPVTPQRCPAPHTPFPSQVARSAALHSSLNLRHLGDIL